MNDGSFPYVESTPFIVPITIPTKRPALSAGISADPLTISIPVTRPLIAYVEPTERSTSLETNTKVIPIAISLAAKSGDQRSGDFGPLGNCSLRMSGIHRSPVARAKHPSRGQRLLN